ncbi:MAG: hypothetical protein D6798_19410 [Deltaproteobacteria bacterium]|nr:MAG: hypothetical protein D6798_19410 [Deltaproteobacteria bacterium]
MRFVTQLGALLATVLVLSTSARAQEISFDINDDVAAKLGLDPNAVEAELQANATRSLRLDEVTDFLGQMAQANQMATKGMGVDYASNPQRFVVGGGLGTAVNSHGVSFQRGSDNLPTGGFAFQAAVMGGLNLGAFTINDKSALRRFIVYVHGLAAETALDPFRASFTNYGANLQVQLIGVAGGSGKPVEWGGLALTAGYESSRYKLTLESPIPITTPDVRWDADGALSISTDAAAVPIELSTNVRILVATAFGGIAYDRNLTATSAMTAELVGPVSSLALDDRDIGTGLVRYSAEGSHADDAIRAFIGAQANVFLAKAYGQLNFGLDRSFGGHVGLRLTL